jgi:hypothetical protein
LATHAAAFYGYCASALLLEARFAILLHASWDARAFHKAAGEIAHVHFCKYAAEAVPLISTVASMPILTPIYFHSRHVRAQSSASIAVHIHITSDGTSVVGGSCPPPSGSRRPDGYWHLSDACVCARDNTLQALGERL